MTASSPMASASAGEEAGKTTFAVDETVKPSLVKAEYAVRGAITVRAAEIERELKTGTHAYNFDKILYCNIGNPQALDQKPVSFPRRLIACCECPEVRLLAQQVPSIHNTASCNSYSSAVHVDQGLRQQIFQDHWCCLRDLCVVLKTRYIRSAVAEHRPLWVPKSADFLDRTAYDPYV